MSTSQPNYIYPLSVIRVPFIIPHWNEALMTPRRTRAILYRHLFKYSTITTRGNISLYINSRIPFTNLHKTCTLRYFITPKISRWYLDVECMRRQFYHSLKQLKSKSTNDVHFCKYSDFFFLSDDFLTLYLPSSKMYQTAAETPSSAPSKLSDGLVTTTSY